MYDLAIIGGGPAGLTAAIHARARDKTVLLVTNDPLASPLAKAERVDNYPGLPNISGKDLVQSMVQQAGELGVEIRTGRVLNIMPMGETKYLSIGSDVVDAKAVIIAGVIVMKREACYRPSAFVLDLDIVIPVESAEAQLS